jgi:hypothetical protein
MAYIELLPPEVIEMQKELVLYHPTLCRALAALPLEGWEDRLAAIATYCDARMDGNYTVEQVVMVIERLIPLLREKREVQPGQQVDYRIPGKH